MNDVEGVLVSVETCGCFTSSVDGDEFIEVCDIDEVQRAALSKESDLDVDDYEELFGKVEEV